MVGVVDAAVTRSDTALVVVVVVTVDAAVATRKHLFDVVGFDD